MKILISSKNKKVDSLNMLVLINKLKIIFILSLLIDLLFDYKK